MTTIEEDFSALVIRIRKEERRTARREVMDMLTATEALEEVATTGLMQVDGDKDIPDHRYQIDGKARNVKRSRRRTASGTPEDALAYIKANPGCSGEALRDALGLKPSQMPGLRENLGKKIKLKGQRRGTRYYVR